MYSGPSHSAQNKTPIIALDLAPVRGLPTFDCERAEAFGISADRIINTRPQSALARSDR
jgi:hypothetical protein